MVQNYLVEMRSIVGRTVLPDALYPILSDLGPMTVQFTFGIGVDQVNLFKFVWDRYDAKKGIPSNDRFQRVTTVEFRDALAFYTPSAMELAIGFRLLGTLGFMELLKATGVAAALTAEQLLEVMRRIDLGFGTA